MVPFASNTDLYQQQWMPRLHVHQFVQVYSDIIPFCWIEKQIQSLVLSSPPWDIQLPKGFTEVGHLLIGRPAPAYSYCTPKQIWLLPEGFGRPWVWVPHTLLLLKYSKFVCRWCYSEPFLMRKSALAAEYIFLETSSHLLELVLPIFKVWAEFYPLASSSPNLPYTEK